MIDLHTHTTASDGTLEPAELVAEASARGIEVLAITDHDTFAGYDAAVEPARQAGIELFCGIELSTKLGAPHYPKPKSIHLLGYWFKGAPAPEFREWIRQMQASRRDRNIRLCTSLQSFGIDIRIEEVEEMGRSMAGRPHFAALMVRKGYVKTPQEAFDLYLDESAKAYVDRDEPSLAEGIRRIRAAGGLVSIAHPVRLGKRNPRDEEDVIRFICKLGCPAIEAWHPDHSPRDTERFQLIAKRYQMALTGGSDFHGGTKPGVDLGTGRNGNVSITRRVLDRLRSLTRL